MNEVTRPANREVIVLPQGIGRTYSMGRLAAVFKADGEETLNQYSISEWWLNPDTAGPGAHSHPEDDIFYVIEGTMSFFISDQWVDAPRGTFILIPGNTVHNFENRSDHRAGVLNFSVPGDFEKHMPSITRWFTENPAGNAMAT
jgi:quercetin dioxygenase-like cupin family protein